jgi:Gram-negative bacterial TonB protein C-terminal
MKASFPFIATLLLITLPSSVALVAQQPAQDTDNEKCAFPTYKGSEVDRKLKILAKPEPEFSREERRKHAYEKIILIALFCGSGEVTKIRVKTGLSDSVDAKAIEAARKIRFIPGEKDGKKVSQWLILEYHI